jgi:hypothetical protein
MTDEAAGAPRDGTQPVLHTHTPASTCHHHTPASTASVEMRPHAAPHPRLHGISGHAAQRVKLLPQLLVLCLLGLEDLLVRVLEVAHLHLQQRGFSGF